MSSRIRISAALEVPQDVFRQGCVEVVGHHELPGTKAARARRAGRWIFDGSDFGHGLAVADDEAVSKELKALAGSWKLVSSEVEGVPFPKDKLPALSFKLQSDGKSTCETPDGEFQMSFVVDPVKTPKTIDMEHLSGPSKGQKQYGIYKVDGDRWTVLATPPGYKPKDRPLEFNSKEALGPLVVWERVKDDKKR